MKKREVWYNESGLTDDWLKANDPDYGDVEECGYFTARQYRKRAREKEIPTDPDTLPYSAE
jgi:hypothetical protein